ncbi:MAG: rod shape-determining protein MreC [Candidatus Brocadiaceae bacterium]|nr:rod shape-determining protein MreC [Candidatus Brocadiaceae bacterium]
MRTSAPSFGKLITHPLTTFLLLLIISLVFLYAPKQSNHIKMLCVAPVRPLQWATCVCSNSAKNIFTGLFSFWHDAEKRAQLEEQVFLLQNKVKEQQDIIYKLKSALQNLSNFQTISKGTQSNPIPADIIGYDTSLFRKSITINLGSKHGVRLHDIVVSQNALVGIISTVSRWNSVVRLITDPSSRIPARILETREQVILEGNATSFCQLKYVPRWSKVEKGNNVVSTKLSDFYLSSLPIATVAECKTKGGALFQSVKVLPKVNIAKIEHVLVIPR